MSTYYKNPENEWKKNITKIECRWKAHYQLIMHTMNN